MEKKIIELIRSTGKDRIQLEYLIDLGDEYDEDNEPFAITCDMLMIEDGHVIVTDSRCENPDGSVDNEDKYLFNDLDDDRQKQALWCLEATLAYINKNK